MQRSEGHLTLDAISCVPRLRPPLQASVNMAEETVDAEVGAAWGLVAAVGGCSVWGLGLLLALTYSVQSVPSLFNTSEPGGGHGIATVGGLDGPACWQGGNI